MASIEPSGPDFQLRDALAGLCRQLDDLAEIALASGAGGAFDQIIAAIRDGDSDLRSLLVQADELFRRCGVAQGLGIQPGRGAGGLPALPGHPVEEGFVCPVGRCRRVELPGGPQGAAPRCALFRTPLRQLRL